MAKRQDITTPHVLANKPSSSFSGGSATSAATSRSGGSKLLFGEIDLSSDRSSESYASVCSFVLSDSGTFLKFWLEDRCRDTFLSYLPKDDLSTLRLVGHDFSVRAAPALLSDLSITFKTGTFTRPAKLAALDRLGFYVKTLRFNVPHTQETFLPPLVEPDTGEELSFTYTPQVMPSAGRPKYGDVGTTEILTRQYPALFHAATNVPAFVRAFSAFINLQHLQVCCPGYDESTRNRRSVVDFALISLRIAVERNCLNALDSLTLSPIHPGALQYLSPLMGYGATPRSARTWSRIQHLAVHVKSQPDTATCGQHEHCKLLQTYLRTFQQNVTTLDFGWLGAAGPLPIQQPGQTSPTVQEHPANRVGAHVREQQSTPPHKTTQPLHFPKLRKLKVKNIASPATSIKAFALAHKQTIQELDLEDTELTAGTWDEALSPLTTRTRRRRTSHHACIPIMLSPSTLAAPLLVPMERVDPYIAPSGRPSMRLSKWFPGRAGKPAAHRTVRQGLLGCEGQLKKVFGGVLAWK
ncbi:hypothetical protein LTR02_008688 [Friedmanniomyces endolithicus]|nr:hypothetical protein LTR94_011408 [Friedmanniomyces endolithicus]KAK0780001.1 hypothetical protein LTR59_012981 [Friedmanniomyces endolithicus]KAK0792209.1 hypothetical protein LTR38_009966 [Friedmanniomyces endolithicus]KAK0806183.1 hypothetical protein LTR75_007022 [Friedmanniomyces endolithicus]KAK0857296.1 hypothetical protein LTR03_000786 [Friedmanniomyces endolithicus]